jgi:hypothetical protein
MARTAEKRMAFYFDENGRKKRMAFYFGHFLSKLPKSIIRPKEAPPNQ